MTEATAETLLSRLSPQARAEYDAGGAEVYGLAGQAKSVERALARAAKSDAARRQEIADARHGLENAAARAARHPEVEYPALDAEYRALADRMVLDVLEGRVTTIRETT